MIVKKAHEINPGDMLKVDDEGDVKRVNSVVLQRDGKVACRMVDASWEVFQHREANVNVYNAERIPTYRKSDDNTYRLG